MENLVRSLACLLVFLPIAASNVALHYRGDLSISEELYGSLLSTSPSSSPKSPTTFFEVRRPIPVPKTKPCSTLVLQHDFAYTYGKPPLTAAYSPPSHCPLGSLATSRIVLEWSAACAGRQFDRIFGVWLGGVEVLRSCTAEPLPNGVVWTIRKDVTRYSSLFSEPQTLAVYLGNIVDKTYTGIYHVNVSFHFYFDDNRSMPPLQQPDFGSSADLIIPISNSLPLDDGLWFEIQNSTDVQGKEIAIPRNTYRALLEVYVSYHSNDEFWYTNPPNSYILENNLTGLPGNGAFREVTVRLDGHLVGCIWPFTVIYTGGINPLLWRPISAIGSFDLPSYDIEITPFLGNILDGKNHSFEFSVIDAMDVWFIDANLHLWLDENSIHTEGSLVEHEALVVSTSLVSQFKGLDGHFDTIVNRTISSTGWVKSSYGKITTHFFQNLYYTNYMNFSGNGSIQTVNQSIEYNYGTFAKHTSSSLYSDRVFQRFPLYLHTGTSDEVNRSYSSIVNITVGFNKEEYLGDQSGPSFSILRNLQHGTGIMHVKGNLVTSGAANTEQVYTYESSDGCFFRNVRSNNYTILFDESGELCTNVSLFRSSGNFPPRSRTWMMAL